MSRKPAKTRWVYFHSALQLAVQRSAHKWTFEHFAECFPQYVEEDRDGAKSTFNTISDFIETKDLRDLEQLMKDYGVQANLDILHRIVDEAKERKKNGTAGDDVWKDGLDPAKAVAARTVPVFEREAARLKELLAQAEEENRVLDARLRAKLKARDAADARLVELLDKVDAACENWESLPQEDLEKWAIEAAESIKPDI